MVGFEKYERLLNKKKKLATHLDLMTENSQVEACDTPSTNGFHANGAVDKETSETGSVGVLKEDLKQIKKRLKELQKKKMERPKLFLTQRGEKSLLNQHQNSATALNFDHLMALLMRSITNGEGVTAQSPLSWCNMLRCKFISQVVLVIVEGIGAEELIEITEEQEDKDPPSLLNEEGAVEKVQKNGEVEKRHLEETGGDLGKGDPPPSKKRKKKHRHDEEKGSSDERKTPKVFPDEEENHKISPDGEACQEGHPVEENGLKESPDKGRKPEPSGRSELLSRTLPLSSPLFALHLNVTAPTQLSCDPLESILCMDLSQAWGWRREVGDCDDIEKAVEENIVLRTQSKGMMLIENGLAPPKLDKVVEDHKDNISRLDLLLSLQEMIDYEFPLRIEGDPALNDPEFKLLHPCVDKVTPTSPMFGIDCEMCLTTRGSELTWVSVVDEELKVLYAKYVRPEFAIVNYLTKYSGVTKAALANVATCLADVQEDLRKILPKDAILVGHHFSNDLQALKLFHPYIMDTSLMFNISGIRGCRPGLKVLAKLFLGKNIQRSSRRGHNPAEDAAATIELALLKLRHDTTFADAVKKPLLPFSETYKARVCRNAFYEKIRSRSAPHISEEYKLHLFMYAKKFGKSAALISTTEQMERIQPYLRGQADSVVAHDVKKPSHVLKTAISLLDNKFLVCHCQMSDKLSSSKEKSKSTLAKLDKQLARLREALPEKAVMMTVFTGSPWSVPLSQRSNAVAMIDVVGQSNWQYFTFR